MYENGPLDSGDYGDDSPDHTTSDYELWEAELKDNENIARLSHELGRFSLQSEIEVADVLQPKKRKSPEDEDEKEEEPELEEELFSMETSPSSSDGYLLGDEMYGAAMGLIYLTTGIPVDEIMKG